VSTSTSQDLRCPQCDAHVRAGSQWCPLCYVDLRPAPQTPEPVATPAPGRGKHARGTAAATEETPGASVPEAEVELMLAQLAAAESSNTLGKFAGYLDSPGRKAGVMIGGGIGLAVVVFLLMALVGVLL
jgi:hypothetical protein